MKRADIHAPPRLPKGEAFDPWRTWRDHEGPVAAVAAAVLAANPRNHQAWSFEVTDNQIDVFADLSRSEPALDPFHRELHIGLGCALENLVLAARANGLAADVRLSSASAEPTHVVSVRLQPAEPEVSDLYLAIPHRRTNRAPFRKRPVPAELLDEMTSLGDADLSGTALLWFTSAQQRRRLGDLLVASTEAMIADHEQSHQCHVWFRKSAAEVERHRDGTTVETQGLPTPINLLSKVLPRQSQETADRFWLRRTRSVHTATAAAYGMITVPDAGSVAGRVSGGRLLQRIQLFVTAHGLALGHLNMMTVRADRERQTGDEPRFTRALADLVGTTDREALATFRIGYSVRAGGVSPRRPLADVARVSTGLASRDHTGG